jgi:hypothetical protein
MRVLLCSNDRLVGIVSFSTNSPNPAYELMSASTTIATAAARRCNVAMGQKQT